VFKLETEHIQLLMNISHSIGSVRPHTLFLYFSLTHIYRLTKSSTKKHTAFRRRDITWSEKWLKKQHSPWKTNKRNQ